LDVIRIGIIGYGYWGPNLSRNFHELPNSEVVVISDLKEDQLKRAKIKYPDANLTTNYQDLFKMGLDAVVVSSSPKTHFKLANDCLEHGLHVLVEKPLTLDSKNAEALIKLAESKVLVLMTGHTFIYNPGVKVLKNYIQSNELGDIYYLDTARLNLGLYQHDLDVIWDLAPHDISILLYLLDQDPISVSAQGVPCVIPHVHDVAYLSLIFPNNLTAYVHVSWLDPCKVRRVTVVGSKKMIVYNDLDSNNMIKIYDKGIMVPDFTNSFGDYQYSYRSGDVTIPSFPFSEPLRQECQEFLDSIINNTKPISDGYSGLKVTKILEAASRSMANKSTHELIDW
jgi:predicted dehydrogenase